MDKPSKQSVLDDISLRFAHGECACFAMACHRAHGWPLVLFENDDGVCLHAACVVGEDLFFDAYGFGSLADMNNRYAQNLKPSISEPIDVDEALGFFESEVKEADDYRRLLETILESSGKISLLGSTPAPSTDVSSTPGVGF